MSKKVGGLPLIEKKEDCPAGGDHEDLPFVMLVNKQGEEEGDQMAIFFCLKCKLAHWAIFPKPQPIVSEEPSTHDDNPILDGLIHA